MIVAASQKLIFLDCLNHLSDSPSSISIKASLQVQPSHMVILPSCLATKEFLLLLRVSKCRWRAGVRLSGGNQSQAGVLGLWPTNCTHPAAGETNSSWPLLPTRIIQPVCHRLGQSVQPMDSSTRPLMDGWWNPRKRLPPPGKVCAGAGAGVLRRRIPRILDMGHFSPRDGWQMVKACALQPRHLSNILPPNPQLFQPFLFQTQIIWGPRWWEIEFNFAFHQ